MAGVRQHYVPRFRPFTEKGNIVLSAFLPLTPVRILVGETQPADWDWAAIKRQLARCSLEYFIADENSAENQALHTEIGTDAAILTDDEIDVIVSETFGERGGEIANLDEAK